MAASLEVPWQDGVEPPQMNCPYCRANNEADDHRCGRCGRRLTDADPVRPRVMPGSNLAHAVDRFADLAPEKQIQPEQKPRLEVVPPSPPEVDRPHSGPAYQASLFGPQLATPAPAPAARKQASSTARSRTEKHSALRQRQANFDFEAPVSQSSTSVYLDAPVAPTPLRAIAAGVDVFLSSVGFLIFAITARGMASDLRPSVAMLVSLGVAWLAVMVFYRVLFCIAGIDTPGLTWTGLRLMNFDGHQPTRKQRLQRLGGGFVGFLAAGMGLWWALFDEHKLTWHDHISETFATAEPAPSAEA
jgi:uncharacterized RDD family membrane protein YckC